MSSSAHEFIGVVESDLQRNIASAVDRMPSHAGRLAQIANAGRVRETL